MKSISLFLSVKVDFGAAARAGVQVEPGEIRAMLEDWGRGQKERLEKSDLASAGVLEVRVESYPKT